MGEFEEWLATRPPVIQEMGRRCPPDRWYGLNDDGDYYRVFSYFEDGTVKVIRYSSEGSPMWRVFGVDPADLYLLPGGPQ